MEIRDLVAKISAGLLKRRGNGLSLSIKPMRASLADIPLKSRQKPAHRPPPPIRPASNM